MKHDEFIKHVQSAAQFNSREEAEHATRATGSAERTSWEMKQTNGSTIAQELGQYLRGREGENGQYCLEEFIQRVSEKGRRADCRQESCSGGVCSFATSRDTR